MTNTNNTIRKAGALFGFAFALTLVLGAQSGFAGIANSDLKDFPTVKDRKIAAEKQTVESNAKSESSATVARSETKTKRRPYFHRGVLAD